MVLMPFCPITRIFVLLFLPLLPFISCLLFLSLSASGLFAGSGVFSLLRIVRLFENHSVSVTGMKGTGKDMLFANVVKRRKGPYMSNTNYGGDWIPLDLLAMDTGNTYKNFITGKLNHYEWPFPDGMDIYLPDSGVLFPAHYCNELNRDFRFLPTTVALSRQLGKGSKFHFNCQALGRTWLQFREQSDVYIRCLWICEPLLKLTFGRVVLQKVIVYDRYESCADCVPVFPLKRPLLNLDRQQHFDLAKANYLIAHGTVKPMLLFYWNRSNYSTYAYKEMLANA